MFTVNKTHVSDTTQCSARQWNACPSEHLPVRFARLPLILLGICDHTFPPGSEDRPSESKVQSASLSSFQSWSSPTEGRGSFMGSQGIVLRSERTTVGKMQNSNVLRQTDIAK